MKSFVKYLSVLLALLCAVALWACSGGSGEEPAATTAPESTSAESTDADTTQADPPEKPVTYTLPLTYEKEGVTLLSYAYGEDGLSLSMTDLREENPVTYTVYFDENGIPQYTEWLITVNDQRTELWKDVYTLDGDGRIVEEKRYCEGQLQFTYYYTYDIEGRMLTQRSVKEKNKSESFYTLLYDGHGTCIGIDLQKDGGSETVYREHVSVVYDDGGRVLSVTSPSYIETHDYYLKSNFVTNEKVTYKGSDGISTIYYQYTYVNGKLYKADCSFNGSLVDSTVYVESKFAHYESAVNWIFRERLP